MRVILDTNVIISALLWGGKPDQLLKKVQSTHTLCFSPETLKELREVLNYQKFRPHILKLDFTIEEAFERLTENALIVSGTTEYRVSIVKEDPSDNKFLACALAAQASFIVSGDKHLLRLKEFWGIPIITPHEFLGKRKG